MIYFGSTSRGVKLHYRGITRFRNIKLGVSGQYRTILKKKNMGQNRFKKLSKFQKFQSSNFTFTRWNKEKINGVPPDITYSKFERTMLQKMKILDKFTLKKMWIKQL